MPTSATSARLTPTLLDGRATWAFVAEHAGRFAGAVARAVPPILAAQLRQLRGLDPGHP